MRAIHEGNGRRFSVILLALALALPAAAQTKLKVLIVDGQNNHAWAKTTPVLKDILDDDGRFETTVATSPPKKQPMDSFKPDFAKYDVILSNYNGDEWPQATKDALVKYMREGGGLVIVHAADNSFPKWPEFNEMIAVGGWGGRDEKSGPLIRWRDGKIVLDNSPGRGGTHGPAHEYLVVTRVPDHPIMKDLPTEWLHTRDELYANLRGPAKNVTVLATAQSKKTKEHEPALMTIDYGKGRVFHTILGHDVTSHECVGFVVTLVRGTEWAATGKVTPAVLPKNFPAATKASVWKKSAAGGDAAKKRAQH